MASGGRRTGTVSAFDEQVGLGEITADDGTIVAFQCIVIADGTRRIDVGTRVTFDPLAKLGRYEAGNVAPIVVATTSVR
jgi:cold shock CspA family protein